MADVLLAVALQDDCELLFHLQTLVDERAKRLAPPYSLPPSRQHIGDNLPRYIGQPLFATVVIVD